MTRLDLLQNKQPIVYNVLNNALKAEKLAHAYLFAGIKGSLQDETALLLVQSLFCEENTWACGSCPICKRLGLYQFQLYLENGVFKILHPEEYDLVLNYLRKKYPHADRDIIKGKHKIEKLLASRWVENFSVTWRVKSPYRVYEKLIKKYHELDFSKILDIMAFRIVVDEIPDCYNVLWIIHSAYNPLINKIKDYIAVPKFNNYQSLHTTILGFYPFPLEIQIRTKEMNTIAEFWVAAHFLYKEKNGKKTSLTPRQSEWMKDLQDSVQLYQNEDKKESFKNKFAIELLDNSIFVYTPKWDVIELSRGSTVLDFAFKVHTDIGLKFKNAIVNSIIKPINYVLQSGDIVSININKNKYNATKYWIDYLHTTTAKSKLARFLKQQERDNYIKKWITLVDQKLKQFDLPLLSNDKDKIRKYYGSQFDHNMIQVASKAIQPLTILKDVYQVKGDWPQVTKKKTNVLLPEGAKDTVIIDDSSLFEYQFCQLCSPKPYEKIIARSWKDGLKIHTLLCNSLKTVHFNKLIKARRSSQEQQLYFFEIVLQGQSQQTNIVALLTTLQWLKITIEEVTIQRPDPLSYTIIIHSHHENPSKIAYFIDYIQHNYWKSISIEKSIS